MEIADGLVTHDDPIDFADPAFDAPAERAALAADLRPTLPVRVQAGTTRTTTCWLAKRSQTTVASARPAESSDARTRRRSCGREGVDAGGPRRGRRAPGRAKTVHGRVAADTSSDGACGV